MKIEIVCPPEMDLAVGKISLKSPMMIRMKRRSLLISVFVATVLATSCGRSAQDLRNGDLIFVGIPADYDADNTSMDAAISAATGKRGQLNITHVAIAEVSDDGIWSIDATPKNGVARRSLEAFLEENKQEDGSSPVYVVKRVNGVDADAAVARAKALCGRAYDLRFLPDNEDLYCSELIQKCYLDERREPVFESQPMNFLAADGTMPPYWEQLFRELGIDVPQDVPGTNPQRMSESARLKTVPVSLLQIASSQSDPVREAIRRQITQYPETRVQDIYKSFCQDCLGPGHLIPNPDAARAYLMEELQTYRADLASGLYKIPAERYVPVGDAGNYVRVDLSVVLDSLVDAETLLEAFVRSANEGETLTEEEWKAKWTSVAAVIREDFPALPDAASELAAIDSLMAEGHYILHHSPVFEQTYHPHYRIVARDIFEKELKN